MARTIPITTPDEHEAALERLQARYARRPDANPWDQTLDLASGSYVNAEGVDRRPAMQPSELRSIETFRAHHEALKALALGAVHGISGPAVESDFLVDGDGNVVAYEKVWKAFERQPAKEMWKLPRAQAERLGRWNIPAGEKSRVQKQLGLREAHAIVPAEREVRIEFDYSRGGYRPDIVYVIRPL